MPASGYGGPEAGAEPPLLIRRADRAPLGGLLLAIASLWLAAALDGLAGGDPAIVPGLGGVGAYLAGALGAAFALIALDWMVRGRSVTIDRVAVAVTERSLLGVYSWREPLSNYREIRAVRERRPHRYDARSWYVVRLCHADRGKAIELARAKDPALIERRARDYAERLGLPLCWDGDEVTASHGAERPGDVGAASAAGQPLSAT